MHRPIRALVCCALISALAACVAPRPPRRHAPPPPPPPPVTAPPATTAPPPAAAPTPPVVRPNPHEAEMARFGQVDERIDNLNRRIDERVSQGYYPPPTGNAFRHRLDVIRQEMGDMAAQHDGGLSPGEQRILNQELDGAARAIGN